MIYNNKKIMVKKISRPDAETGITTAIASKIRQYVNDFEGIMLDYNGSTASICMGWDIFTDEERGRMLEDDFIIQDAKHCLGKDGISVKEIFVDENGVVVYVFVDC